MADVAEFLSSVLSSVPSEDAARKLIYLAIQNAVPQWTRTRGCTKALLAFKIHFGDRRPD
jgi:transposase-like protein